MPRSITLPVTILFLLAGLAGLIDPSGSVAAQVLEVPGQHATIQAALNAARAGNVIQVDPGTYQENLVWPAVDGIQLVSVQGAAVTTIHGGDSGRVVQFGTGLTRATVLEGFTVTHGRSSSGAGVHIQSSPTLRFNRIRVNIASSGAGVCIDGGSALLDRNRIESNRAITSGAAYGAGIHVVAGAPEIRANIIRANYGEGSYISYGAGICIDAVNASRFQVVGNVIVENRIESPQAGYGGGVAVLGGPVGLLHNTVANNQVYKPTRGLGAGIYFAPTARPDSRLLNNIVSGNAREGIRVEGVAPYLNYNDVWGNATNDYAGVAPGPDDLSVDPDFAGSGDFHLAPTSPLIDAGANLRVPRLAGLDFDGDPRFVDGKLEGHVARADIGADEFSPVRLEALTPPYVGRKLTFEVRGLDGSHYVLFWSPYPQNIEVQPFGLLLINGFSFIDGGITPAWPALQVPAVAALTGAPVLVQGLVMNTAGSRPAGAFTNRLDLRLVDAPPFVREVFLDRSQRDPSGTTAQWSEGPLGLPGLHATFGYGGHGEDGPLIVTGRTVLDSSTRQPGVDGVVEWNLTSLTVMPQGVLTLEGQYPVRLKVLGNCVVQGTIDLSGTPGNNAPAGRAAIVGRIVGGPGGPGAGAGGDANTNPLHPIGSLPMELRGGPGWPRILQQCGDMNRSENRLITVIEANCGGGAGGNRGLPLSTVLRSGCSGNGGGHERDGMQTDSLCNNIGAFGREFGVRWVLTSGTFEVSAPTSGTGGGAGGNAAINAGQPLPADDIVAGAGGGGGGGLEIEAFETILLRGQILADGGHGGMGYSTLVGGTTTISGGWGGGGSGGSIWLSSTSILVDQAAIVSAQGGQGNPNPPKPVLSGDGGDGYVIVRDLGGNPTIQSVNVTPAPVAGRLLYQPASNGVSEALSRFYDSGQPDPQWAFDANDPLTGEVKPGQDLLFSRAPAAGQKVYIAFQGAPDLHGQPDPDPRTWIPRNGFEPDITKLRGQKLRHLRFHIRIELGARQKGQPAPGRVVVREVTMRF